MNIRWKLLSRREWREAIIIWAYGLLTLFVCVSAASLNQTVLDRLTFLVFDVYQRVLPREETNAPIVLVDIDEASLAALGQWPWPRSVIADIVDRLRTLGAASIAFDMVFPEPDRTSLERVVAQLKSAGAEIKVPANLDLDNDMRLARSFAEANVVSGIAITDETNGDLPLPKAGFAFGGSDPKTFLPKRRGGIANIPILDNSAKGIGFFSFPPGFDGIIREIPILTSAKGALYPALSIEALRVAQGASSFVIRTTGSSGEVDTGSAAMTALKAGDFETSTGPQGDFWIYYSGLPHIKTISAATLLDSAESAVVSDSIAGSIVVIGTSAIGLRDIVATPIAASMPGMRVHAEILDQIISGTFLTRPDWVKGAETFAAFVFGLSLIVIARPAGALISAAIAVALIATSSVVSWYAFSKFHLLVDPILPSVTTSAVFGVIMPVMLLLTSREKKFVRGAFSRYLSPSLVEKLADNPSSLMLGGELRDLTVLFCDIRGFTSLSENLDPQHLTALLNDFLTPMSDVLLKSEATIDKYMGDAIMAFWNAPLDIADHRRRACLAALKMVEELKELNIRTERNLKIGIGLNAGPCCVGNLGSAQRFSYSAIGDGVNVASRVEGLSKEYGVSIILTESVCQGATDLAVLPIDIVQVVGRTEPLTIYTVIGDDELAAHSAFHLLAAAQARFLNAYRAGDLPKARAALTQATSLADDRLAALHALYEKRLSILESHGIPEDWDGVHVAKSK